MTKARILADYVAGGTTASEFDFMDGVTSNVQTQMDAKLATTTASSTYAPLASPTFTGTTTVSGDLVPATPLSNRNMIINGAMQVWQRSTDITASDGSNEGYNSVDRWYYNFNSACPGTLDIDRSTDTPDGFGYSMKLKCNATGTPVSSSGDFITANMRIEAQDMQHLNYGSANAETTTLSWYMKSVNYTDPLTFSIQKPDGTASYYLKSFTPTTSWARYSMTIPANTNAGHTITNDGGVGFVVQIALNGSDGGSFEQTGASSAWDTPYKEYINDIGNFFADTSNELFITGVQLELGSTATPFEHRSYGEELARCQRYYTIIPTQFGFPALGDSSSVAMVNFTIPVPLRGIPAIEQINSVASRIYDNGTGSGFSNGLAYQSNTSHHLTINEYKTDTCNMKCTLSSQSNLALGKIYQWVAVGSYKIGINAEL